MERQAPAPAGRVSTSQVRHSYWTFSRFAANPTLVADATCHLCVSDNGLFDMKRGSRDRDTTLSLT